MEEIPCVEYPRRPYGTISTTNSRVSDAAEAEMLRCRHHSHKNRDRVWIHAWRQPRLSPSSLLAGFRAWASASCRFRGGARERTFGEVAAAGRAFGGWEENAGPRHLQRDGRQPLQLVSGEHCREVPGQKWPADDDPRGPQGTHQLLISPAPILPAVSPLKPTSSGPGRSFPQVDVNISLQRPYCLLLHIS